MADNGSPRVPRYPFTRSSSPAEPPARDSQSNDPLSELARLIGQQDPFVDPVPPPVRRDLRDILAGRREPELPSWSEPDFTNRRDPNMPGRRESDWAVAPEPPYHDQAEYQEYQPARDDYHAQTGDAPVFELPRLEPDLPPAPYEAPSEYGQGSADVPLYGDNGQLLTSDPAAG